MRIRVQDVLARATDRLLHGTVGALQDLSLEELHFRPGGPSNSIGFDAWHIARTADNVVHFVFEREQPVWAQQGLHEAWRFPKVEQGTGMAPSTAFALRFPPAEELARYVADVAAAIVPRLDQMSDDELRQEVNIRPQGVLTRCDAVSQVIVDHGNNHYGEINLVLTLLGKPGLGI